jgi:SAM-dependent methyltransferase
MVARERFGVPVFVGSLEQAKLPREGFDVVTFFDVLEHLPAPRRVLEEAIALLKPGGLLVAQSPNLRSLMAWLTGDLWHWYVLPNHLHHFTPSTMERLLHSAGLTPVHTITLDVPEEFANNLQDRFPRLRGPSALKVFLRRALNRSLRAGTRAWAPGGFGGLVRCFARKSG